MNNAKTFFEDYMELGGYEIDFMKKHWLGMSIITVGACAIELAVIYREPIKDEIKTCVKRISSKIKKNNEEEVSED